MNDVVPCLANPAWKRRAKERMDRMRAEEEGVKTVKESVNVKARAIVEALISGKPRADKGT